MIGGTMPLDVNEFQLIQALKRIVADAWTLAFVFIVLGALGFAVGFAARDDVTGQLMTASCGVVMLAPGILYALAGVKIRNREAFGARLALWAAVAHIGAIPLLLLASLTTASWMSPAMIVPAVVSLFFVPALIAFLFSMNKARQIARMLGATGHGFAVLPAQSVLPIEPAPDKSAPK